MTAGVPVAPRCTPSVAAASGTDLARPVAGGLDQLAPVPSPGPICVGSAAYRVARAPAEDSLMMINRIAPVWKTAPGVSAIKTLDLWWVGSRCCCQGA